MVCFNVMPIRRLHKTRLLHLREVERHKRPFAGGQRTNNRNKSSQAAMGSVKSNFIWKSVLFNMFN